MDAQTLIRRCLEVGIDCLAVTDHNTILGALEVRAAAPFPVIVGEEVRTLSGEVMGLFLTQPVPPGLPWAEAVAQIKAQEGIVGLPHPFDRLRRSRLHPQAIDSLLSHLDAVEVFNARTILPGDQKRARLWAQAHSLPATAGSDAHIPYEVGRAYVEMEPFDGPQGFLSSLRQGQVGGAPSPFWVHAASRVARWLG